ncbi:MAG: hypothetical protein KTR32_03910 [Granulosicoccus sp.]|nr:hypothetical protein [Granulosicoccus sp.]
MNTQTHMLLGCAVLALPATHPIAYSGIQTGVKAMAALLGALLPDASIFIMWGIAKLKGIPESEIWQKWYYSDFWQQLGAITNSLPMYLLIGVLAYLGGGRWTSVQSLQSNMMPSRPLIPTPWATLALILSSSALLHVLTDLPLHHDDGHPHFWPISDWIYSSPVSYWDPAHYGHVWSVVELLLAMLLLIILWRRFLSSWVRVLLLLAAASYAMVATYWWLSF